MSNSIQVSQDRSLYNSISQNLVEKMSSFGNLATLTQSESLYIESYRKITNVISMILEFPDSMQDPMKFSSFYNLAITAPRIAIDLVGRTATEITNKSDTQSIALKEECIAIGLLALCTIVQVEKLKADTGLPIVRV